MKQFQLLFGGMLIVCLLLLSCNKEKYLGEQLDLSNDIGVKEAKVWFEQNYKFNQASAKKKEELINLDYQNLHIMWDFAEKKQSADGRTYLQIPLMSPLQDWRYYTNGNRSQLSRKYEIPLPQLLIYKDGAGQNQMRVMELLPDQFYLEKHKGDIEKEDYSGLMFLKNWDGKLFKGYCYENGKKTKQLNPISPVTQNGRTSAVQQCITYVTYGLQATCVEFGTPTVYYDYITIRSGDPMQYPPLPGSGSDDTIFCSSWDIDSSTSYDQCTPEDNGGGDEGGGGTPDPTPDPEVPPFDELKHKATIYLVICDGYRDLVNKGYANNNPVTTREMGGVIGKVVNPDDPNLTPTGNDRLIMFPVSDGDGATRFTWKNHYTDERGRTILSMYDDLDIGKTYVQTHLYLSADATVPINTMYEVNTLVHSHPYDSNNGLNLDANNPSGDDFNTARWNSHLKHRIISREQIIDFNGAGVISRQTNNCK